MIIVFGSINMDVNTRLRHFPARGETVLSPSYDIMSGGKGANQALACARGGAKTALVGKIGDDAMGTKILNSLRRNEVMTSGVGICEFQPTGMAFVMTEPGGDNRIVVAAGANGDANADQIPDEILKPGNILLVQMELPLQEIALVMERAHKGGATVIMNYAPAVKIPPALFSFANYLVMNEVEIRAAAETVGVQGADPAALCRALAMKAGVTCIVTLGDKGAIAAAKDGHGISVPALKLEDIVDTTGAGDCFCGTLASSLHNRIPLHDAMRRASIAAGLSCQKRGAQDSYPYIAEIEEILPGFPPVQVF